MASDSVKSRYVMISHISGEKISDAFCGIANRASKRDVRDQFMDAALDGMWQSEDEEGD